MTPKKKRFSYALDTLAEETNQIPEQELGSEHIEESEEVLKSEQEKIPEQFMDSELPLKRSSSRRTGQAPASLAEQQSGPVQASQIKQTTKKAGGSKSVQHSEDEQKTEPVMMSQQTEQAVSLSINNLEGLLQPPMQRGKRDMDGTGRMAIAREQTTLRLRPELKRAAAAAAALQGITLGDLIEQALVDYLSRK